MNRFYCQGSYVLNIVAVLIFVAFTLLFFSAQANAGCNIFHVKVGDTKKMYKSPGVSASYISQTPDIVEVIDKGAFYEITFKKIGDGYVAWQSDKYFVMTHYMVDESAEPYNPELEVLKNHHSTRSREINEIRVNAGLCPLEMYWDLNLVAAMRAGEVADKRSHIRPNGEPYYTALPESSYSLIGENITCSANGSGNKSKWLEDEALKNNIMNPFYTELGIGISVDRHGEVPESVYVYLFRRPR